jgi:hypothetical protein
LLGFGSRPLVVDVLGWALGLGRSFWVWRFPRCGGDRQGVLGCLHPGQSCVSGRSTGAGGAGRVDTGAQWPRLRAGLASFALLCASFRLGSLSRCESTAGRSVSSAAVERRPGRSKAPPGGVERRRMAASGTRRHTLRKLAFITAGSLLALVIAIGCSDSDPPPPRTSAPPRESTGSSGSDASTGAPDCTKHAKVDDRPACDQCAREKCCKELVACDDNAGCKATMDCLAACQPDDPTCGLTCSLNDPGNLLLAFGQCAKGKCGSECPDTSSGDGGPDFDAF